MKQIMLNERDDASRYLFSKKENSEQLNTRSWTFNADNPKNEAHEAKVLKRRWKGSKEEQKFQTNGVKVLIRKTRPKSNKRFTNFLLTLVAALLDIHSLLQHHHLINFSQ